MTQKWYLRNTQTAPFPTSGEKSTTQPVAAQTFGLTPTDRDLLAAKGTTATTQATNTPSSTSAMNGCLGRWASPTLAAGTYGSGSWTLALQSMEASNNANIFSVQGSIYFWRPSNNSVVGFVVDTDTAVGVEFGNNVSATRYGQVLTLTGSNVTILDGDILVIELWTKATAAMAAVVAITVCYDGTTDVTAAYAGTDPASYLQAPADIPVKTIVAPATVVGTGVVQTTTLVVVNQPPAAAMRARIAWGIA